MWTKNHYNLVLITDFPHLSLPLILNFASCQLNVHSGEDSGPSNPKRVCTKDAAPAADMPGKEDMSGVDEQQVEN